MSAPVHPEFEESELEEKPDEGWELPPDENDDDDDNDEEMDEAS